VGYTLGQCTAYVAQLLGWLPQDLGNADQWLVNAGKQGLPTVTNTPGYVPPPGSVAVWSGGPGLAGEKTGADPVGHVAVVQGYADGKVLVSEMNWSAGPFGVDQRQVNPDDIEGYILPPGSSAAAAAAPASPSSTNSSAQSPGNALGQGLGSAFAGGLSALFGSPSKGTGVMGWSAARLPALLVAAVFAYVLLAPRVERGVNSVA
jgi:surface antigen